MKLYDFPEPPNIDEETLRKCQEISDFFPIALEWYEYVLKLANFFASTKIDSDDFKKIPTIHHAVLVGLLNRCSRLMFANLMLSRDRLFGETTAILDRCIFESAVKIVWLCTKGDAGSFERLILDGLKTEVEFHKLILENIKTRGGSTLAIEERMLTSIDEKFASVPTTASDVEASPKLPDMASMIQNTGQDRMMYVVSQRMGSHHIHGTWPSLLRDYLVEHDGILGPRDHDCPTHEYQYVVDMLVDLNAISSHVKFIVKPGAISDHFKELLKFAEEKINPLNNDFISGDFQDVQQI